MLDLLGSDLIVRERHELGIVEKDPGQRAHLFGHRRRKQAGLAGPAPGDVGLDLLHVRPEPEREQLIRLVEDEEADRVEFQAARSQVVEDAPRGSDDDVGPGFDSVELRLVAHAAVDRQTVDADVLSQGGDFGRHLIRELAGGEKHQGLGLGALRIDFRNDRDAEGPGFSRSGLGLHDEVASAAHDRDHPRLHRCRFRPLEISYTRLHGLR